MPVRVLVVDDSVVVRRLVADTLGQERGIEVVGTAPNGRIALAKISQLCPDLITLDLDMPVMDGLELLDHLQQVAPRLPVLIFSTITESGAPALLTALERGARDHVAKPADLADVDRARRLVRETVVPKVLALCPASPVGPESPVSPASSSRRPQPRPARAGTARPAARSRAVELVVVGSSTGGPEALSAVVSALPPSLPVPVLVTQHMPPVFTKRFADRLDQRSGLRVAEAVDGEALEPGRVLVAPGDYHLAVDGGVGAGRVALDRSAPENFCRPAVDVMFRTAASAYGPHVLAVVLTGMGVDGARGAVAIVEAGGVVIAQDEASSVVWGMPGAVVANGTASRVVALEEMAAVITARCARGRGQGDPGSRSAAQQPLAGRARELRARA